MGIWIPEKIWAGQECWILGGGPSVLTVFGIPEDVKYRLMVAREHPRLLSDYMDALHHRNVIGINNAYRIGDWIDIVFFGDCSWYNVHRAALLDFPGQKVTCCRRMEGWRDDDPRNIRYMRKDGDHRKGISTKPGHVSWNSNSGLAALSLAVQLGVSRVFLLGFDTEPEGLHTHWHGSHRPPGNRRMPRPEYYNAQLRKFDVVAEDAERLGLEILTVNPKSRVPHFPRISLQEALGWSD